MKTIGDLLKKRREQLNISLEDAEKELRIRKKYLRFLEENNFNQLPSTSYIKGFIRNYSRFLGLDEEKVLAFFRRQFEEDKKPEIIPKGLTAFLNEPVIKITPQRSLIIGVSIIVIIFFAYLLVQLRVLISPPPIELFAPSEDKVVNSSTLIVKGKTLPDAKILVNGREINLDKNGNFHYNLELQEGVNSLTIEAIGSNNKKTTLTRNIRYKRG